MVRNVVMVTQSCLFCGGGLDLTAGLMTECVCSCVCSISEGDEGGQRGGSGGESEFTWLSFRCICSDR